MCSAPFSIIALLDDIVSTSDMSMLKSEKVPMYNVQGTMSAIKIWNTQFIGTQWNTGWKWKNEMKLKIVHISMIHQNRQPAIAPGTGHRTPRWRYIVNYNDPSHIAHRINSVIALQVHECSQCQYVYVF